MSDTFRLDAVTRTHHKPSSDPTAQGGYRIRFDPHYVRANDVVRFVLELFAIISLCVWGFSAWPFAWNLVWGIVTPLVAIALWALFRSPRSMISVDAFGKAVVEVIVMGGAALSWLAVGQPLVTVVFAAAATVSGVINGRREFR